MQDTAYTTHTYKHTTIGFLADIKDMPNQYAYSKIFFDRWYRPENCTIIVAGDVEHEALVALVKQYYGGWKRGKADVEIPVEPPQTEPKSARLTWPLPTLPTFYLAYHIPAADPGESRHGRACRTRAGPLRRDQPALQELVLKEQKVVMMAAEAEPKRDPGLFSIFVRVRKPEDLPMVRARITAALAEAAKTPIDPARLDAIKSHLRYAFAGSLSTADAVANAVGAAVAITGRPGLDQRTVRGLRPSHPGRPPARAAKYFQPDNETAIILETEIKK